MPVGATAFVGPVMVAVKVIVAPRITGEDEAVTTTDGVYCETVTLVRAVVLRVTAL